MVMTMVMMVMMIDEEDDDNDNLDDDNMMMLMKWVTRCDADGMVHAMMIMEGGLVVMLMEWYT